MISGNENIPLNVYLAHKVLGNERFRSWECKSEEKLDELSTLTEAGGKKTQSNTQTQNCNGDTQ